MKYIVGQTYRVPCVLVVISRTVRWCRTVQVRHWVPVIGDLHEDKELLGVEGRHWHIDWRFISRAMLRDFGIGYHRIEEGTCFGQPVWLEGGNKDARNTAAMQTPQLRSKKCKRKMPRWAKKFRTLTITANVQSVLAKLHTTYAGRTLDACERCPHRGLSLAGIPAYDGVRTCPGHGLRFDRQGRVVPINTPGEPLTAKGPTNAP